MDGWEGFFLTGKKSLKSNPTGRSIGTGKHFSSSSSTLGFSSGDILVLTYIKSVDDVVALTKFLSDVLVLFPVVVSFETFGTLVEVLRVGFENEFFRELFGRIEIEPENKS